MSDRSLIEWTDATMNPIRARTPPGWGNAPPRVGWHCEHVSEGCRNCYAERINLRLGTGLEFKPVHLQRGDAELFLDFQKLTEPLRWQRPRMIFVNSMTDTFGGFVRDEWIDSILAVASLTPQHTYQILTKRSARMLAYFTAHDGFGRWGFVDQRARQILRDTSNGKKSVPAGRRLIGPLRNVWLGVSAESQPEADERIAALEATPAAVRFLSLEPLLRRIDLDAAQLRRAIHWIIAGGESGPKARPMHPEWLRLIRDRCEEAGRPLFVKQWGEWAPWRPGFGARSVLHISAQDGRCGSSPGIGDTGEMRADTAPMARVGKAAAGRELDGVLHSGFPPRIPA